jgi:hypothetical protein
MTACQLALKAAHKLMARPRSTGTDQLVHSIFGIAPAVRVSATKQQTAGALVAAHFRDVEHALRTKGTLYRCDDCRAARAEPPAGAIIDAYAIAFGMKNEVWLCPDFWRLTPILKAGVVLHEMFHIRFFPGFGHGPGEKKLTSAYCYEAFALMLDGKTPEPLNIKECKAV